MSRSRETRVRGCRYAPGSSPNAAGCSSSDWRWAGAGGRWRIARAGLCWHRPIDQERRRRHPANSRYPRVGRT
ncbi:hypothetical protein E1281_10430 [Actinomadura sp. KC345]|uniref:hypothetical protein n=1 Tax=Actinomadura sp. KC345 TaxID=2530371 RepID=UPI001051C230|nr:hypothetical protein [Actinomadura sp. KC345]TDC55861.1 hypothetical protein E1281_10430 [Actinomadura sp. KC345]